MMLQYNLLIYYANNLLPFRSFLNITALSLYIMPHTLRRMYTYLHYTPHAYIRARCITSGRFVSSRLRLLCYAATTRYARSRVARRLATKFVKVR